MAVITGIGTANPNNIVTQVDFANYFSNQFEDDRVKRKIRFICDRSGIEKRYSVLENLDQLKGLPLDAKLTIFNSEAPKLALKSIENNPAIQGNNESFTDIIMVSCTGMKAPGIEFELIKKLKLPSTIRRYNINFMGCYASLIAIRLANEICRQPNRKVLIVSVELCTLHFQVSDTDDYLLSNSLFSDGAASVVVQSEEKASEGWRIEESFSQIISADDQSMSWNISQHGFLMTLSKEIPSIIRKGLKLPTTFLKSEYSGAWAIHPGGRQILESTKDALHIAEEAMDPSYRILKDFGNMSSASVLFILKNLIPSKTNNEIVSCAFGPGLTFEAIRLSYE